jgi:rhamnose transport system permease protein
MNRIQPEQIRVFSLLVLLIALVLFFGAQIPNYLSARTFTRISTGVAIITVVAVGQTLVVLTRNIDLSVGSIVGATAYAVGTLLASNNMLPAPVAVLFAMGMGALAGAMNGVLVAYGKVPSIIVTLGTLAIYRTTLVGLANAKTITIDALPQWLKDLPRANLLKIGEIEIRVVVALAIAIVIAFQLVLVYLRFGRRLYAIGSNPDAAGLAGLPSQRIVLMAYVLCGALAGLAGFMFLARFGTITVVAAQGMELQSVAAVVVGGVNIFGGSGSMIGTLLGATLVETIQQSLIRVPGLSEFWIDALLGLLILLAVASDAIILNRLRRAWAAKPSPAGRGQGEGESLSTNTVATPPRPQSQSQSQPQPLPDGERS